MHLLFLSLTEFGINKNILETNVLNLAVVIGVLYFYIGKIFFEVLDKRRERVIQTIVNAEEKYEEARVALKEAKFKLIEAQYKAASIRSSGRIALKRLNITFLKQAHEEEIRQKKTEYKKRIFIEKNLKIYIYKNLIINISKTTSDLFFDEFPNLELQKCLNYCLLESFKSRLV